MRSRCFQQNEKGREHVHRPPERGKPRLRRGVRQVLHEYPPTVGAPTHIGVYLHHLLDESPRRVRAPSTPNPRLREQKLPARRAAQRGGAAHVVRHAAARRALSEAQRAEPKEAFDRFDRDKSGACAQWSAAGECEKNPGYMKINCAVACKTCGGF